MTKFQINQIYENTLEEKKSQFITYLFPVTSEGEVSDTLNKLRLKNKHARHFVYAYIINNDKILLQKSSDDGEPEGTAGKPVMNVIQKQNFVNVLCVVVRYFGGIKLGAGGLTRAYTNSASNLINQKVDKIPIIDKETITLELPYNLFNEFNYYLSIKNYSISTKKFTDSIKLSIVLPVKDRSNFLKDLKTEFNDQIKISKA